MVFLLQVHYLRNVIVGAFVCTTGILFYMLLRSSSSFILLDPRLSDTCQKELLQSFMGKKYNNAHKLLDAIVPDAPVIQDIDIRRTASLKTKIVAHAYDPLYRVKNTITQQDLIVTSKQLIDSNAYIPSVIKGLPNINLEASNKLFDETTFIDTMLHLPKQILDIYTITYKNKTEIILVHHTKQLIVIADRDTIQDEKRIAYAELLAEKKYKKQVTIDIRFAHGAVCSPKGR